MVCRERTRGALVHRPLSSPILDADLLSLGDIKELQPDIGNLLRNDFDSLRLELSAPLVGWIVSRAVDHRSLILSLGGKSLTAQVPGDEMSLEEGAAGPSNWFMAISETNLDALRDILSAAWLVRSSGESEWPETASMDTDFKLRIGDLQVDLRWNLPFDTSQLPHRLTLLRDGWRIAQIYRYRPLVYYAAFGSPTMMRQFAASLYSLVTAGAYQGDVAVLTDRTDAEIRTLVPPAMRGSVVVLRCEAADRTGYTAARLAITGWRDAWNFQPLLYVDTDILFDLAVAPMLHAIARSDRISAPVEPTELLATSVFVGEWLFIEDNCSPGAALGFNTGTLGIPNLARHARSLDLIGRIMRNHSSLYGREALPYADQAAANYVSYRVADVDIELISPFVRLAGVAASPSAKRGLVHFCWIPGADARVEAMQTYMRELGWPIPRELISAPLA